MVNLSAVVWHDNAGLVYLVMKVIPECQGLNVVHQFSSVASPF